MKFLILFLLCVSSYSSEIFEGDMILSKSQATEHYGSEFVNKHGSYFDDDQKGRHLAGLTSSDTPWKEYRANGKYIIPYTYPQQDETGRPNLLREEKKAVIESAMRHVENMVDYVLFVPKNSSYTHWLNIGHFTDGCYTYVGLRTSLENQGQILNLATKGPTQAPTSDCATLGIVSHELLHTLGLYHEQSRFDRDTYVTINFDNIDPTNHDQFAKQTIDTSMGIDYDYGSVMHYSNRAFGINNAITIVPTDPNAVIGQRDGLSASDALIIKYLYRCPYHDKGAADHCTTSCPCPDGFIAHCSNENECEGNLGCQNVTGLEPHITAVCGGTRAPTPAPTPKPTNAGEAVTGFVDDFIDLYTENLEISIVVTIIVASSLYSFFRWLLCSPAVLNEGPDVVYVEKEPAYMKVPQRPEQSVEAAMRYII